MSVNGSRMVEVVYQPWKKIVVHEKIEYNLDELVRLQSLGVEPGGLAEPLFWADGVVFSRSTMFDTEDVIKEKLEGVVHWSSVEWALMPESKGVIIIKETNVKVPIINVSAHPIYKTVSKWLREQVRK
jgi:hypothetical protein